MVVKAQSIPSHPISKVFTTAVTVGWVLPMIQMQFTYVMQRQLQPWVSQCMGVVFFSTTMLQTVPVAGILVVS